MIASNVGLETLKTAAGVLGLTMDATTLNAKGTRHRIKLYPDAYAAPAEAQTKAGNRRRDERGDHVYQRLSVGYSTAGRRVHAVCWHGFRDFFREVFKSAPDAVFRTAVDTWRGAEDFEARYRQSGGRNIGPQIAPVAHAEACRCKDAGVAA